jgi:Zn finger protein HypA/HybF involved in hydrogenase expression
MTKKSELRKIADIMAVAERFKVECRDCGKETFGFARQMARNLQCPHCHSVNTFRVRAPNQKETKP